MRNDAHFLQVSISILYTYTFLYLNSDLVMDPAAGECSFLCCSPGTSRLQLQERDLEVPGNSCTNAGYRMKDRPTVKESNTKDSQSKVFKRIFELGFIPYNNFDTNTKIFPESLYLICLPDCIFSKHILHLQWIHNYITVPLQIVFLKVKLIFHLYH